MIVNGEKQYSVDDILDCRRYRGRLQYRVQWSTVPEGDLTWYNADNCEFEEAQDTVNESHRLHPGEPKP